MIRSTPTLSLALILVLAGPPVLGMDGDKIQPELRQAMEESTARVGRLAPGAETERFRVVVILKAPEGMAPEGMNLRSASDMSRLQAEVSRMQESVLTQRLEGSYRMLTRYQSTYGFSAFADSAAIEAMARLEDVERIELMPVHYKMSAQSHPLANVDAVHDLGFTGEGVTIAIVDDGIDHDHPAFGGLTSFPNAKILGGRDFADNDDDPTIDCLDQSHGTSVAGVAAGNGGGITGTAPDATVVMLKVQSAMLCGEPALDGDLAGAIDWVVTNRERFGIRVLSMSLGGGAFSSVAACESSSVAIRNAVNAVAASGVVILAASGNDGLCAQMSRPACEGNAISVGAVYDGAVGQSGFCVSSNACNSQPHSGCSASGRRACFDNAPGADDVTCYSNSAAFLDILAPSNCATTARSGGGTNNCFGGTSSATPFAAGVAAALIEADGDLDNDGMRALLAANGVPVTDTKSGLASPRVDAQAALAALDLDPDCPDAGLASDFEDGEQGWTATGLWHRVTGTSCASPGASSGATAFYYGRDGDCDYDAGNNSGTLTSPPITGITAASTLSFQHLRQVESFAGGSFDRTSVEVIAEDGTATTVFSRDSADASAAAWVSSGEIGLGAFAGQTIQVRFGFDTMDAVANGFTGWLVDDVVVTGSSMCMDGG